MTDDVAYLILHRVTIWDTAMPGSTIVVANCGHRGWIAPSSKQWLKTVQGQGAYLMCTDCMGQSTIPEDFQANSVPGAKEEWHETFGPGFEKQFAAFLKGKWHR